MFWYLDGCNNDWPPMFKFESPPLLLTKLEKLCLPSILERASLNNCTLNSELASCCLTTVYLPFKRVYIFHAKVPKIRCLSLRQLFSFATELSNRIERLKHWIGTYTPPRSWSNCDIWLEVGVADSFLLALNIFLLFPLFEFIIVLWLRGGGNIDEAFRFSARGKTASRYR